MRIESSRFEGAAFHAQRSDTAVQIARLSGGAGTATRSAEPAAGRGAPPRAPADAGARVNLSGEARARFLEGQTRNASPRAHRASATTSPAAHGASAATSVPPDDDTHRVDPSLRMLVQVVEWLTGHKVRIFDASDLEPAGDGASTQVPVEAPPSASDSDTGNAGVQDSIGGSQGGSTTVIHARYSESESLDVSLQGSVHTADGRDLSFTLSLSMHRSFSATLDTLASGGGQQATDPLVINLDSGAARLSDRMFQFDLDGDGSAEDLHAPGAGTGLLVFDRNGNGQVDDNAELFGPTTANGFTELAALDDDGNGWIDEGDAAFAALGVWTSPQAGSGVMMPLARAGIGALSTQSVAGDFSLKDAGNATTGIIRSTGVYLRESGAAGTMQQLDLVA